MDLRPAVQRAAVVMMALVRRGGRTGLLRGGATVRGGVPGARDELLFVGEIEGAARIRSRRREGGRRRAGERSSAGTASRDRRCDRGSQSDDAGLGDESDAHVVDATDSTREAGAQEDASGEAVSGDGSSAYLGCFADSIMRDLPFAGYTSVANTGDACIAVCALNRYRYAATQSGQECFCGNAYGGQGPGGNCATPCPGNMSEVCGGPYQNSVYVATGVRPSPAMTYEGCYADGINVGDAVMRTLPYTLPCTGDASETCGGNGAEGVYRTSVPADAGADQDWTPGPSPPAARLLLRLGRGDRLRRYGGSFLGASLLPREVLIDHGLEHVSKVAVGSGEPPKHRVDHRGGCPRLRLGGHREA
jgi:WSC domain